MAIKKSKLYLWVSLFVFTLAIGQVSATEYQNYYEISMTSQQYNNLLNLGFSENEIYYMDEETFNQNKDISSTLVSKTEKYYKTIYTDLNGGAYAVELTEDEYHNQSLIDPRGTITTEYKTMVSTVSQLTNKFRFKVSLGWNRFPAVRSYDVIGVGYENDNISIETSVNFSYTHCISTGECTTSTLYYDKKNLSTGGSVVYKLPSHDITALTAVLYYDVIKNTSDTITQLEMCGDYSHATSSSTGYTQYSGQYVTIDGILLGSYGGYYDAIPCAMAGWQGTW